MRSSSSRSTSTGSKPSTRDHSARYGVAWDLRLETDEVVDDLERLLGGAFEEELPRERGAVEGACGEDFRHRAMLLTSSALDDSTARRMRPGGTSHSGR